MRRAALDRLASTVQSDAGARKLKRMSLLDARPTSAWTTIQIDYGPAYGSKRYGGWAPQKYLDNMAALAYASQYPLSSSIFQWNGRAWQPMIKPESPAQLAAYNRKS